LVHDLVDAYLLRIESKLYVVALEDSLMLEDAVDAIEFGRDRARTGSSGHSQVGEVHVLLTGFRGTGRARCLASLVAQRHRHDDERANRDHCERADREKYGAE
jgi:hypothetical protein